MTALFATALGFVVGIILLVAVLPFIMIGLAWLLELHEK